MPDDQAPDPDLDPIIELYERDVDRTLIRENLRRSHEERILTLQRMVAFVTELRAAKKVGRGGR